MKKIILIIVVVIAIIVAIISANKGKEAGKTASEEFLSYEKDKQINIIDTQLKNIDLEKIRTKENLILEKSIEEIQNSIKEGKLSYEELTAFYLDRIKRYDSGEKGLNSVSEINPNAISIAKSFDNSANKGTGITGISVLIKDNINTKDMPTSGGTFALKDFIPKTNATLVDELIKNGAIILGKANLSELANFMDTKMPSGYSSKTGQTHNPIEPNLLSPSGSSSGSGSAVAANLSPVAIGTETTGSIISPSSIQSIVGYKPSKDLISTEGVMPLSSTMDTVGAMGKTVKDTVLLFNNSITDKSTELPLNLDSDYLKGKRIGISSDKKFEKLRIKLKDLGATVVEINLDESGMDNEFIMLNDFKTDLGNYLKKYDAPVKTLEELIEYNKKDLDRRAKYGQELLEEANDEKSDDIKKINEAVKSAKERLNKIIDENSLDAIATLDTEGIIMPSIAGYPVITVPFDKADDITPVGATFMGKGNEDEKLIRVAYSFEQGTKARIVPEKYKEFERK